MKSLYLEQTINKFSLYNKEDKLQAKQLIGLIVRICYFLAMLALFVGVSYIFYNVTNVPKALIYTLWPITFLILFKAGFRWFWKNIMVYRVVYLYQRALNRQDQEQASTYLKALTIIRG